MRSTIVFLGGLFLAVSLHGQDLAELEEMTIRAAVQRVAPSVVRIETVGGLEQVNQVLQGDGPTTGLIVASDGYILSSAFNFLRQPSSILVMLPGGQRSPAQIVARDHSRKLVLLRVQTSQPLVVPEPVTGEIQVGQTAIAVGRTVSPEQPNISVGIVSATKRIWGKAIQTDAKISPSNYGGPLIDLEGRVLGILVPLSPSSQHEMAGSEWYDGGIGFAVSLAELNQHLDAMKKGQDLHPGLLGITLKPGDIYSLPAELAACHPKSPAFQAGLRAGDTIVAINGTAIDRQAELRHLLGPLYAGDKVSLDYRRGEDRRSANVELAEKIDPYAHPFLGVLPAREAAAGQAGVAVRYVFPGSGAATGKLQTGDRILKLDGRAVENAAALRDGLAAMEPEQEVRVTFARDGQERDVSLKLGPLPAEFPPAEAVTGVAAGEKNETGAVAVKTIKIPEEPNECVAYVPSTYRPEAPASLLITLPGPGDFKPEDFTRQWSDAAERSGMIVAAVQASLPAMWQPTETGVIRKVIDHFVTNYQIDRTRIVVYGSQSSGAMAYLAGFRLRDVVRGVIAVDAAVPLIVARPPDNDPIERLAIVAITTSAGANVKSRVERDAQQLGEMKYPVIRQDLAERSEIDDPTRAALVRWINTLDRI